jgi:hypothetical protein
VSNPEQRDSRLVVFITWSGAASEIVAAALDHFFRRVLENVRPFYSAESIRSGQAWFSEIVLNVEQATYGIICLTPQNKDAPWVLFETGAMCRQLAQRRIVPIYIGMRSSDVLGSPLAPFQGRTVERASILALVKDINRAVTETGADRGADESVLEDRFEQNWPRLAEAIEKAKAALGEVAPALKPEPVDLLRELIDINRGQNQMLSMLVNWTLHQGDFSSGAAVRSLLHPTQARNSALLGGVPLPASQMGSWVNFGHPHPRGILSDDNDLIPGLGDGQPSEGK